MKKFLLLILIFSIQLSFAKGDPIVKCINKKVEGIASIKALGPKEGFKNVYDIRIVQPLDHEDPNAGAFEQRIYLYHKSRKKPMIMVTEGYNLNDRKYELCDILDANQLTIEYRYYGKSVPENADWTYLTNTQAANDLHRIRQLFGKVYKKEWVSTGISKGGTTTMMYKALFPDDVDASVNYVGPLPLAQEDRRMDEHILTIGEDDCRKRLHQFQVEVLKRRDAIIPKIDSMAKADKMGFSIGTGAALEFAALEYTFSFWQYAHNCEEVPLSDASDHEMFLHLNKIVGYNFYSDAIYDYFKPAFYQFMSENGYYGFIHDHVKHLLVDLDYPSNLAFTPKDVDINYDGSFMRLVEDRLREVGNKMIHVHGEFDPWGAVGFFPEPDQDAVLAIKKGGGHTTRIKDLSDQDKKRIYLKLDQWLRAKVSPLQTEEP